MCGCRLEPPGIAAAQGRMPACLLQVVEHRVGEGQRRVLVLRDVLQRDEQLHRHQRLVPLGQVHLREREVTWRGC